MRNHCFVLSDTDRREEKKNSIQFVKSVDGSVEFMILIIYKYKCKYMFVHELL